jgi:hypothetical protein
VVNIDYLELEKMNLKELKEYSELIVEIPKTKEEFNKKFTLKNNEIDIEKIKFNDVNLEDISGIIVEIPKTKEEFNRRFSI